MPRSRTRPPKPPEYGVARGSIQRSVLAMLLDGRTLQVPVTSKSAGKRPPAGMTKSAWVAFQRRLKVRGLYITRENNDYASGLWDCYRLQRLVDGELTPVLV